MSEHLDNSELKEYFKELKKNHNTTTNGESFDVLIIDDDQWIHRILTHYLKEFGLNVSSSFNAFDGIAKAVQSPPILILLDIIMPEVKGDVLLKMLKKIKVTSNVPVIIMSGNLNKLILGDTYKNGAAGFISKPFSKDLVFEKIRECLTGKSKITEEVEKIIAEEG